MNLHFLVDRLHASTPDSQVVRFVRSRLAKSVRRGRGAKPVRKRAYRAALKAHHENRDLYIAVTGGF
jgi:hypothetical protein